MDKELWQKMAHLAEGVFDTEHDPAQIPINEDSANKILALHPKAILCRFDGDNLVSWVVVVPTSKKIADDFVMGKITERELLDYSRPAHEYEALYLCSVFTIESERNKGYATELSKQILREIPCIKDVFLCAWPYTEEGKSLLHKIEKEIGKEIHTRND